MLKHNLPIITVVRELDNKMFLAEALFFPEALRFSNKRRKVIKSLEANLRKIVDEIPPGALYQRHPAGDPEIGEVEIIINPPPQSKSWRKPVNLKFQFLRWHQGENAQIAYIPALNIEIVATSPPTRTALDKMLQQHIRAALGRINAVNSQGSLIRLQRSLGLSVERQSIEVSLTTPRIIAAREQEIEDTKRSVLAEAATDLTKEKLPEAYEIDSIVNRIAKSIIGRSPRSVLLIGRSGVGKTAAVYELARRRADFQLNHTPFWATNGSRLIAGMSGFGQWQERCHKLWREAAQTRAVLYLGNLIELIEVGKSIINSQGIASFLGPYIARGDVPAIAECTPEQFSLIERVEPRLVDSFYQIRIEEPSHELSRNILLNVALAQSPDAEPAIEIEGVERVDQLHRRYASYSAYPGRPVRFLKNILLDHLRDGTPAKALTADDVTNAFSRETGLPLVLLDEREHLNLDLTREWFSSRVIGQPDAVDLIVNLLATVKAELTRPRKPVASLLFIGPTGVGKTEMAKSLTEFLFQDRQRMVRFDMSEYADPLAVSRLIGTSFGREGGSEGLLTARVREQPFSVVLLDEFEKAHQSFFDLLLQVLGEGRLTDAMGRVADFTNAVVIMTSNLGAESFQRGSVGFGKDALDRQAANRHFITAVRQALRPEMFNRIDRIVPFAPLDEETVLKIAGREIERIKLRDGMYYSPVSLNVRDGVTSYFARRGYDVRYGARPLKRLIEREMLVPISEELNRNKGDAAQTLNVWVENEKLKFNLLQSFESKDQKPRAPSIDQTTVNMARGCMNIRRASQLLVSSPASLNLRNEIFALERIEKLLSKRKWKNPAELQRLTALPKLKTALKAINGFAEMVNRLEHELLLSVYGKAESDHTQFIERLDAAQGEWKELLISTYSLKFRRPDEITLVVFGYDPPALFALAKAYHRLALRDGARIEAYRFTQKRSDRSKKSTVALIERAKVDKIEETLEAPRDNIIGFAFGMFAPLIHPRYEGERGQHLFIHEKKVVKCVVHTTDIAITDYQPAQGIERRDATNQQNKRRIYNQDLHVIEDEGLKKSLPWSGHLIEEMMRELMEEWLMKQANSLIES